MLQLVLMEEFYKVGCGYASFPFSPPGRQDQVEGKQRYLANVKAFCRLSKNNWHRVYLVRKIVSQHGMEFAQKLVTEAQFNWVFPVEILQQVKVTCLLGDGSGLLMVMLLCGCTCCCVAPRGLTPAGVVVKMTRPRSLSNGVS